MEFNSATYNMITDYPKMQKYYEINCSDAILERKQLNAISRNPNLFHVLNDKLKFRGWRYFTNEEEELWAVMQNVINFFVKETGSVNTKNVKINLRGN